MFHSIIYIAELSLPNTTAYSIHVIKMINSLSKIYNKTQLNTLFYNRNYNFKKIKKDFMLDSNKKIKIKHFFLNIKNNFYGRILFGFLNAIYLKNKPSDIITRSLMTSLFLILFKRKHILEIHQEFSGLTGFFFIKLNMINSKYIINIICITNALKDFYKKKTKKIIVIPDAVDPKNFKNKNNLKKKIKNIYYVGSFYKGRGIDLIIKLSQLLKSKKFFLYGSRPNDNLQKKVYNNVKIFNFIKYNNVPKIINKSDILLMPYSLNYVGTNAIGSASNTAKYASPLKMFEYLASGIPFISSNLKVLQEILINKKNCLIAKNNDPYTWKESILYLEKNLKLRKKMSKNALRTASQHTWDDRAKKIKLLYN
jgi:glycosyltransferase involved in cell wall biosynthesis